MQDLHELGWTTQVEADITELLESLKKTKCVHTDYSHSIDGFDQKGASAQFPHVHPDLTGRRTEDRVDIFRARDHSSGPDA